MQLDFQLARAFVLFAGIIIRECNTVFFPGFAADGTLQ